MRNWPEGAGLHVVCTLPEGQGYLQHTPLELWHVHASGRPGRIETLTQQCVLPYTGIPLTDALGLLLDPCSVATMKFLCGRYRAIVHASTAK